MSLLLHFGEKLSHKWLKKSTYIVHFHRFRVNHITLKFMKLQNVFIRAIQIRDEQQKLFHEVFLNIPV